MNKYERSSIGPVIAFVEKKIVSAGVVISIVITPSNVRRFIHLHRIT